MHASIRRADIISARRQTKNERFFELVRQKATIMRVQACERRLTIDSSSKAIGRFGDLCVKKRKFPLIFDITVKVDVGVLGVKILEKHGDILKASKTQKDVVDIATVQ